MTPAQKRGHHPAQGIHRHHLEAGELLGRLHQADLGGEGRARTSGKQQGGDHRAQLPQQGEGDQGPQTLLGAEVLQYVVTLQGEHHADEETRHKYDGDRLYPHHIELLYQQGEVLAGLGFARQRMK